MAYSQPAFASSFTASPVTLPPSRHPIFPCETRRRPPTAQVSPSGALLRRARQACATAAIIVAISHPLNADAYGLQDGRLQKCRGDDPCVSTSSVGNPSKFGPPWTFEPETDDADVAWASLKAAVENNRDNGVIVDVDEGAEACYLRAEFPSFPRGIDDVEFRMLKKEKIVTYRSSAREPIYVYPIQTPINTDKNRTRLQDIRSTLGWSELAGFNLFGT